MTLGALATVLHYGYGVLGRTSLGVIEHHDRPVPSAGGLYPLQIYAIVRRIDSLEPAIYHYAPHIARLELLRRLELHDSGMRDIFMGQTYVGAAAVVLVITAVVERTMHKYGDRGYRYILLEAGHVAQNVNLVAGSLGLASLNLGGFFDAFVADLLRLDVNSETPTYAIALGEADRSRNIRIND